MTARLMPLRTLLSLALGAVVALTSSGACPGEDFRVDNKVFASKDKEPTSQSTTIFCDGVAYDYLASPPEVTVLDQARGRIVLLNTSQKLKTELTTEEVAAFVQRLDKWAADNTDPLLRFMSDPKFDERPGTTAGEFTLRSPWLTYDVSCQDVGDPQIAAQYRLFSDWHARLNALINPGALPPTGRLLLNEAIVKQPRIARQVTLTLKRSQSLLAKRVTLRSEHQLIYPLTEPDRRRVAQTTEFVAMFKKVGFNDYQKATR